MLYSFDKKLLGFCGNKKIKSLPLYIFSDLKYLDSTDLVNVEQKRFLSFLIKIPIPVPKGV